MQERNQKKKVNENVMNTAAEVRRVALKSMSQTRKRNSEEDWPPRLQKNIINNRRLSSLEL